MTAFNCKLNQAKFKALVFGTHDFYALGYGTLNLGALNNETLEHGARAENVKDNSGHIVPRIQEPSDEKIGITGRVKKLVDDKKATGSYIVPRIQEPISKKFSTTRNKMPVTKASRPGRESTNATRRESTNVPRRDSTHVPRRETMYASTRPTAIGTPVGNQ